MSVIEAIILTMHECEIAIAEHGNIIHQNLIKRFCLLVTFFC